MARHKTTQIIDNELSQREGNVRNHHHHYSNDNAYRHKDMLFCHRTRMFSLFHIKQIGIINSNLRVRMLSGLVVIDGSPNFKLKYLLLLHSNFYKSIVLICSITY